MFHNGSYIYNTAQDGFADAASGPRRIMPYNMKPAPLARYLMETEHARQTDSP